MNKKDGTCYQGFLNTSDEEECSPILDEHTGIYLGSVKKPQTDSKSEDLTLPINPRDDIGNASSGQDHNVPHRRINQIRNERKCNTEDAESHNSFQDEKSRNDLRLLLNVFDHPVRYSINTIRDPIRQCKRIASVHHGDYGHTDTVIPKLKETK